MMIMIVCYSLMGRELWGSRSIGEHTERQLESMKSKKKVRPFYNENILLYFVVVSANINNSQDNKTNIFCEKASS